MTELWKPLRVGDYWQCATPTGPYNFSASTEREAVAWCNDQRRIYEANGVGLRYPVGRFYAYFGSGK
jgi:hypothetical protein